MRRRRRVAIEKHFLHHHYNTFFRCTELRTYSPLSAFSCYAAFEMAQSQGMDKLPNEVIELAWEEATIRGR